MTIFHVIKYNITTQLKEEDLAALPKGIYKRVCRIIALGVREHFIPQVAEAFELGTASPGYFKVYAEWLNEHRPGAAQALVDYIQYELKIKR